MTLQSSLSVDALLTVIVRWFLVWWLSRGTENIINQTGFLLTAVTAFWSFGYWRWLFIYVVWQRASYRSSV